MLVTSAATAAIIWTPTSTDTDFILGLPGNPGVSTNGGTLALFDDSDTGFGTPLDIGPNGDQVVFTDNNDGTGTWNAENTLGLSITLSGNTNFLLGIKWDDGAGYFGDSNFSLLSSPDTYLIVFDGSNGSGDISGNMLAVDLEPIPLPAAAWLLGTGLLGLVGIVRRRRI